MRQIRTILIATLTCSAVWFGSCTASKVGDSLTSIRLDIDRHAIKAIAFGTASRDGEAAALDRLGNPRAPASLAIVSPTDDGLFVIDVHPSTLRSLRGAHLPHGFRAAARRPLDGILLTHLDEEAVEGIRSILEAMPAGESVPLFASQELLEQLTRLPELAEPGLRSRMEPRAVTPDRELDLSHSVTVRAVEAPFEGRPGQLGWLIRGQRKTLLYLPNCGSLRALASGVDRLIRPSAVVLLDGLRFDAREPLPAGAPAGSHPPIQQLVRMLQLEEVTGIELKFTHLGPANAALDPNGWAVQWLRDRGCDLLDDRTEYWL